MGKFFENLNGVLAAGLALAILIAQQPARIGTDGVEQAIKAIKGEATTASIRTGFTIITQSNLNSAAGRAAVYKTSC